MGCSTCGAPTSRRQCRECARLDRWEEERKVTFDWEEDEDDE